MDPALKRRMLFWLPTLLILLAVMVWLFYPKAVAVDLVAVQRGPLQVTVGDEGETRVKDLFVVSAPITGFMRRVELEPGDKVVASKTVVARLEPADPGLLDARTQAMAQAALSAAASARTQAQAETRRADAELDYARTELKRTQALAAENAVSKSALDAAQHLADTATATVEQARAMLKVRESEYQRAQAQLWSPDSAKGKPRSGTVAVYSPVSGVVLRVVAKSEAIVPSSAPIIELGDPAKLEIKVDLLSADAVKVKAGQRVVIGAWGGDTPLAGVVRQVEPYGFTKVSALGIEEQRVRVLIDFVDAHEVWQKLGHGYRVEPRIVIWSADDVLQVPLSSLFRDGDAWAVFVSNRGRAELRHVSVGQSNGLLAEITAGLQAGEQIVSYPDDRIAPDTRITQRDITSAI